MRKSGRKVLRLAGFGGALVLGLAVSEHYAASRQRAEVQRILSAIPADVGSLAIDPWRRSISLRRVALAGSNVRITVGRLELTAPRSIAFGLVDGAAAGVASVTAHDIRIEAGDSVLSIPRIEARGTGLNGVDLARLFEQDSPKPLAARLAKLSIGSILVPEIVLTPASGGADKRDRSLSVHGLSLANVVNGRIGSLTIDGASTTYDSKDKSARTASIGHISASGVDLPLALNIAQGIRSEASAPLRPLYDAFSIASIKVGGSATEGFEIGAIQSTSLLGRPLLLPLKAGAALVGRPEAELSPEDRVREMSFLVDVLTSFSLGRIEFRDLSYAKTGGDDPTSVKLGRFVIDGFETFRSRSIAAEHFELADKDVRLTFSRSALEGVDGSGFVDVMGAATGPADIAPTPDQIRRLAPKLANASLLDFRVEVPVTDLTGNANAGRSTVFSVPVAEMRVGGFVGNLASDVSSHLEAVYDVSSPAPESSLDAMAKAGFGHLDLTSDYAANWSDTTHEFKLDQLSLAAKDLAAIRLSGELSNMSPDLMSPDKAKARQAAEQLQFRSLSLGLVNSGLAEKGLPLAAASMNVSVADLKSSLTSQGNDLILKLLGGGAATDQLEGAVARFIDQPKTLDISVKAPESLSLQAITSADNPRDLLKKLEITAVANR